MQTNEINQRLSQVTETAGYELSVLPIKRTAFMRGWTLGKDPEIQAAITQQNEIEYHAAKQALLAKIRGAQS